MLDLEKDGNHVSIVKMESYLRRKQLNKGRIIMSVSTLDRGSKWLYIIKYDYEGECLDMKTLDTNETFPLPIILAHNRKLL